MFLACSVGDLVPVVQNLFLGLLYCISFLTNILTTGINIPRAKLIQRVTWLQAIKWKLSKKKSIHIVYSVCWYWKLLFVYHIFKK